MTEPLTLPQLNLVPDKGQRSDSSVLDGGSLPKLPLARPVSSAPSSCIRSPELPYALALPPGNHFILN